MIDETTSNLAKEYSEQIEKLIKESAEQGYDWLVELMPEYRIENEIFKGTIRFERFKGDSGLEAFEKRGYRIFNLKAVREYLNQGGIFNESCCGNW